MHSKKTTLLRIAVPAPLRQLFDYVVPEGCDIKILQPGIRVRVPFQHRELIGILLEVVTEPAETKYKLKQAIECIDIDPVIPQDILELCLWAADYYHYPVGEVLDSALPVWLRQGKPAVAAIPARWCLTGSGHLVDLVTIRRAPKQVELLRWLADYPEGVTAKQLKEQGVTAALLRVVLQKGWVDKIPLNPPFSKGEDILFHPFSKGEDVLFHPSVFPPLKKGGEGGFIQTSESPLTLNAAQQQALSAIQAAANAFHVLLLDGVTGSGKTEVYLQAITHVLMKQQQILILVPEIGLTPQTIQRFQQRFSVPIVALHSGLSDKERLNAWLSAKSGTAKIIIGTRSAVFSPAPNLGLIIVDEEHDLSFKQQDGFRYHARDLAIMRARDHHIPIVLGSATPSLESLSRAQQGRYQHLHLPQRAGIAQQPEFHIVDIRNAKLEEGLSVSLINAMKIHLEQGDQVMLFLNRRGYAPVLMCHACGWTAICKRCDARMTFHHAPRGLHCHHCDARRIVPVKCDNCHVADLQIIGLGTERLEQALQKYFPAVAIARIDRDSTQRKGSMEKFLQRIQNGDDRILIGTQMLAKGHHFPEVTLVGIVDADSGFFSADFRAIERMGQQVLQVAGRAGRVEKPGAVMIQTRHPDHPLLQQLLRENYRHFASTLLQEREQAALPPFAFLALFRAEAHYAEQANQFLHDIKKLADAFGENLPIWGPVPAPMARRAGRHRAQLLVQAKQRPLLHRCLKRLLAEIEKLPSRQKVRWSLDVDPLEMF